MTNSNSTPNDSDHEAIIDYPIDRNGQLVTRRGDLARLKPRLGAPPATQPGSVDWTMTALFGTKERAIAMIESLVAGQGENADEKWVRFILLYKKWTLDYAQGRLEDLPTLNQVCHSLNFDATTFVRELQNGVMTLMKSMSAMKAAMASPKVVDNLIAMATSPEADVKQIELALKVGGVLEEQKGVAVNINNTNQNAVVLKGDREKQKSPLLQFQEITTHIDAEVRNGNSTVTEIAGELSGEEERATIVEGEDSSRFEAIRREFRRDGQADHEEGT